LRRNGIGCIHFGCGNFNLDKLSKGYTALDKEHRDEEDWNWIHILELEFRWL